MIRLLCLALYRSLLALRADHEALSVGELSARCHDRRLLAYIRRHGRGESFLVALIRARDSPRPAQTAVMKGAYRALTFLDHENRGSNGSIFPLRANEGVDQFDSRADYTFATSPRQLAGSASRIKTISIARNEPTGPRLLQHRNDRVATRKPIEFRRSSHDGYADPRRNDPRREHADPAQRRLMDEPTTLLRQEMALATSELIGSLGRLTAGIVSIATGGAVLFSGFLMLLAAAVLGLTNVVEPLARGTHRRRCRDDCRGRHGARRAQGRRSVDAQTPAHSAESLHKDKDVLTRSAS